MWIQNSGEVWDLEPLVLVLLVYRGPVKGTRFPRENKKRKSIINMTWIRKPEFECWVLSLISSVALASQCSADDGHLLDK